MQIDSVRTYLRGSVGAKPEGGETLTLRKTGGDRDI